LLRDTIRPKLIPDSEKETFKQRKKWSRGNPPAR